MGVRVSLAGAVLLAALTVSAKKIELVERVDVEPVWSGCPVGFALLTHGNRQFMAYYNADREMTLAQRELSSNAWTFTRLPSKLGWDSHNYVAMALDKKGYLHVSGNMHCVPLVYFRSEKPLDIAVMAPIHHMTGERERRVTYPRFMGGPDGALLFTYRDGSSGNGANLWNRYDQDTQKWSRLIDAPLFDGAGAMNAYPRGPVLGKDGFYHLTWVWRDTPACETCHNFSYIRSRDLVHWENAAGNPVELPVKFGADVVVDPVPVKGGLINPCQAIGFDTRGRVIVTYTKYDAAGNSQLMNARLEDGAWKLYQTSDWNYRWEFSGGGTIIGEIGVGAVKVENKRLIQTYSHAKLGGGRWLLDEQTLKPLGKAPPQWVWPKALSRREHPMQGMGLRSASDSAADSETLRSSDGFIYRARWESLPANRDRPRPEGPPPPSLLRVYKLRVGE